MTRAERWTIIILAAATTLWCIGVYYSLNPWRTLLREKDDLTLRVEALERAITNYPKALEPGAEVVLYVDDTTSWTIALPPVRLPDMSRPVRPIQPPKRVRAKAVEEEQP